MECELVQLASVPVGLVTSALFYDNASSRQAELEGPSEQAKEVLIGLCPTGRLVVFIASFKAQFVACSESLRVVEGATATYQTSFEGLLKVVRDPNTPRPIANAVVVVPVSLETKKEPSSIALVGFSDGCIRAYSKTGIALFSQFLHGEPVVTIHCMAPSGGHGGPGKNHMSILVVFASAVCVLEGWSLCDAVAHAVEKRDQWEEEKEEAPVISHQKWRLGDQRNAADAALLAPSVPSLYDYLCEAGNVGGYDTAVKGGPAPQSQLIIVGDSPMVALYKISKDSGTVNVSEVVSAVASKMTRSVLGKLSQAGGWLGWGGGATPPSRPKPQEKKMVMNLPMSTNIPDERRTVSRISASPLGDLSVCVDGFGRVLLLENHAMTIRRMWKGYRDAQTGWVLVHDTPPQPQAGRRERRRTAAKSSSGDRQRERQRRAQCLVIYLPRRGLVELWPVQSGNRVALFQVGKGCRLLTAPHEVFTSSKRTDEEGATIARGQGKGCGLKHTAVLLCPNGQLLSFLIPFPTLVRLDDSSSHDAHLLQRLTPALQAGDCDGVLHIIATVRMAKSIKEVIERVMYVYPEPNLPRQFPYTVLNSSLRRTSRSDPGHGGLRDYLSAVRQLLSLHVALSWVASELRLPPSSSSSSSPPPSRLPQMLTELCGLAEAPASEVADSLQRYVACKPAKLRTQVVQTLTLKELMQCFDLPTKMGSVELSQDVHDVPTDTQSEQQFETMSLVMKKGIGDSTLFDLGFATFHVLLTHDVTKKTVEAVFTGCGIAPAILLTLLCRVFLCGRVVEANPCRLLQRLYTIVQVITPAGGLEGGEGALADIRNQCSHTHNVGHALLFTLLCHKLVTPPDNDSGLVNEVVEEEEWGEGDWGGGGEGWDTVTEEGEQWVRLRHRLEVLTSLCGAVGLTVMSKMPPLPYVREPREKLTVQLMDKDSPGGCVSVVTLEAVGPWLISHCVASYLVSHSVHPHLIATTHCDQDDTRDSEHGKVVSRLAPVVRLFQHTLSPTSLLVHCTWHAAHLWRMEPSKHQDLHQYVLECASLIPNPQTLAGVCLFLWHSLFETTLVDLLDRLKRGTQQKPGALELVSLSRLLFAYLHQLREGGREEGGRREEREGEESRDALSIPVPSDKKFLMDIVPTLATPSPALVRTYLALLLHTELALLLDSAHNVTSFYPTWVRMAVKRELLQVGRDGRHDNTRVAAQLQHKRTKFLCDSITRCLDPPLPKLRPTIPSVAIRTLPSPATPSPSLEVTEVTSGLFLLGELWGVEVDTVHVHWVSCLFAAGLGERGKEAFQSVSDKPRAAMGLLSLAGSLTDWLIQQIASKPEQLALTAQVPPSQLEWIRKQSSSGITSGCPRVTPTWSSLSQLLATVQPHLPPPSSSSSSSSTQPPAAGTSAAVTIAHSLAKLISLRTP